MESRNVKVVDEHGIDRLANLICNIDVDGSDYVIYWINRDNDNDNLFVSKVIRNNDMTYSMLNIEDSMEKSNISEVVKEMITYAVNNHDDKLTGDSVNLSSGKTVRVSSALFNKEQNINVQKTYITTVKKAVTKVSDEFYKVSSPENTFESEVLVQPFLEQPVTENKEKEKMVGDVTPSVSPLPVESVSLETPSLGETLESPSLVNTTVPEPVASVVPDEKVNDKEPEVSSIEANSTLNTDKEKAPELSAVPNVQPLVFDASKESNLNDALSSTADSNSVPVADVESLRAFGQDSEKEDTLETNDSGEGSVKKGFANSKFVMVVAVMFFVISCVFLGYEVFKYFQIVG